MESGVRIALLKLIVAQLVSHGTSMHSMSMQTARSRACLAAHTEALLISGVAQQQRGMGVSKVAPLCQEWLASHSPAHPHHPSEHQAPDVTHEYSHVYRYA